MVTLSRREQPSAHTLRTQASAHLAWLARRLQHAARRARLLQQRRLERREPRLVRDPPLRLLPPPRRRHAVRRRACRGPKCRGRRRAGLSVVARAGACLSGVFWGLCSRRRGLRRARAVGGGGRVLSVMAGCIAVTCRRPRVLGRRRAFLRLSLAYWRRCFFRGWCKDRWSRRAGRRRLGVALRCRHHLRAGREGPRCVVVWPAAPRLERRGGLWHGRAGRLERC